MAQFVFIEWLVEFMAQKEFIFEWDAGNSCKSLQKHGVNYLEAEDAFNDEASIELGKQILPEVSEDRFGIIARSSNGKIPFISFTIRNEKVRVISVRGVNHKERELYES